MARYNLSERYCKPFLLTIIAACIFPLLANGMEVPKVIHFTKEQYQAQNQNWSIAQGPGRRMFFGNSSGLLMYDGAHWQTFSIPGERVIRAVACNAQGHIFVGGYARAGYWAPGEMGQFSYHSILDGVMDANALQEEIWHFLPTERGLFFQSFSTIYRYHEGTLEVIHPPGNIMFIREVEGRILVPAIHEGIYEYLPDGRFAFLPGTGMLAGKRVATILPMEQTGFLVVTQDDGLFRYINGVLEPWEIAVNEELAAAQANKGVRLTNGNVAIGTILDGVYIISPEGRLLFHINQENGLQNNTVLALYEDQANNLWAGLDRGIDLVVTNSLLSYHFDKKGEVGAVFAAALYKERLYIGTNHGVFFKNWPSKQEDDFQLVPGSQGQAWELRVRGGRLLCAHNSGVLQIGENTPELLYSGTGVYHILDLPFRDSCLLLATYTGLDILRRDEQGHWRQAHPVKGFSTSAKDAFFDPRGRLWVAHPYQGVFCLRFNEALTEVEQLPVPGVEGWPPLKEISASIACWDGKVFVWPDSGKLAYDAQNEQIEAISEEMAFPGYRGNEIWIPGRKGALFKVFPLHAEFVDEGLSTFLQVSLIPNNERIINLNDSVYLIGTEDGYGLFNTRKIRGIEELNIPGPLISTIELKGRALEIHAVDALRSALSLKSSENDLRFLFSLPFYPQHVNLRYRLRGYEQHWSEFGRVYNKEYTNLPPGQYEFQVQSEFSPQLVSFSFAVEPYWYQSLWAGLALFGLLLFLGRLLLKVHENRMARQEKRLEMQRKRELQRQKVFSKNEMLQAEINNKSRMLANSTMELVRKKEMLTKLKKELNLLEKKREPENAKHHLHKMIRQIEGHLSSEEDWEVFEANFNQLHNQFFKRLKDQYPDLTPGDLRLAAYLKMNLSSKEIAPLLNISLRGVENKRYRLRNKLELGTDENLAGFLMQF